LIILSLFLRIVLSKFTAEGGMKKFFSGVVPRTLWIGLGGCVFFGSYESVKELLYDIM